MDYCSLTHVAILDRIQTAIREKQFRVSEHAADEMLDDDLTESQVLAATAAGEMIEEYPSAFPFPACLVLGRTGEGIPVHTVWAFDAEACYGVLVTVYQPDPARWASDLRTRLER